MRPQHPSRPDRDRDRAGRARTEAAAVVPGGRSRSWEPPPAARPLIVTADEQLLDDLLRLVAIAGLTADVVRDAGSALKYWGRAPFVLVGRDVAEQLQALEVAPRAAVVLATTDLDDASVWERAAGVGAHHVAVLPDGEAWLIQQLAAVADGSGSAGITIAVVGGRGGAGASVLAASLAMTATRLGARALLVDADHLGGGLDLLVGGEHASGLRWPDLAGTRGRVDADALRNALPQVDGTRVLSFDRSDEVVIPTGLLREMLAAGRRACDVTVVDLPRRSDALVPEALQVARTTLLIVPAEIRATAAAARVAATVIEGGSDVRVVVRGPAPAGLSAEAMAASIGLPLAGVLAPEPRLAEMIERGDLPARHGRGPLADFCGGFLEELHAGLLVR